MILENAKRLFRRFWICVFLAFVFLRYSLAAYQSETHRFWQDWRRADVFGVALVILVVASVLFGLFCLSRLAALRGKWLSDVLLVGFAAFYSKVAIIEMLYPRGNEPLWLTWVAKILLALIVLSAIAFRRQVVSAVDNFCLLFSPIVVLYLCDLAIVRPVELAWKEEGQIASKPVTVGKIRNIFIFLFDGMSYQRTLRGGVDREQFPHLAKAMEKSVVFNEAYSTANSTIDSVPSMLIGDVGRFVVSNQSACLETASGVEVIDRQPHLFRELKDRGFRTVLLGSMIPYEKILGSGVDDIHTGRLRIVDGFTRQLGIANSILRDHLDVRAGFVAKVLSKIYGKQITNPDEESWRRSLAQNAEFQGWVQQHMDSDALFCFVHYSFPHSPYLYDRNGPVPYESVGWRLFWSEQGYIGNLYHVDETIGKLMAEIEKSSRQNETLWIITADHSARADPWTKKDCEEAGSYQPVCHVPLLIHLPGQDRRIDVDTPFSLSKLRQTLLMYVDEPLTMEKFVEFCKKPANQVIDYRIDKTRIFWDQH